MCVTKDSRDSRVSDSFSPTSNLLFIGDSSVVAYIFKKWVCAKPSVTVSVGFHWLVGGAFIGCGVNQLSIELQVSERPGLEVAQLAGLVTMTT